MKIKTSSFVGGIAGLLCFLVFGLLPSLVYGGYTGVALASALFSPPLHEHFLAQFLILFGMTVGTLATSGLFVLFGATLGAGIASILNKTESRDFVRNEVK